MNSIDTTPERCLDTITGMEGLTILELTVGSEGISLLVCAALISRVRALFGDYYVSDGIEHVE